jgi:hypothetical protein
MLYLLLFLQMTPQNDSWKFDMYICCFLTMLLQIQKALFVSVKEHLPTVDCSYILWRAWFCTKVEWLGQPLMSSTIESASISYYCC